MMVDSVLDFELRKRPLIVTSPAATSESVSSFALRSKRGSGIAPYARTPKPIVRNAISLPRNARTYRTTTTHM